MTYNKFKKNQQARSLINKYKAIRDRIIKTKSSIVFLIRCRNTGIIPKFISNSTKNITNIYEMERRLPGIQKTSYKYVHELQNKILRLTLKQKHKLLKLFQRDLEIVIENLQRCLTEEEMRQFLKFEERVEASLNEKVRRIHKKKYDKLKELKNEELGIKINNKFFVNKTKEDIPKDVNWMLSLGPKYILPVKKENFPKLKIITEGEDLVQTIEGKEDQEIARNKLSTILDNHLNKMRLDNRDKFILDKFNKTKSFLKKNSNILILKADKGNTTVAMYKGDYDIRINNIIEDDAKYKVINKDPTSKLEKTNNEIVEDLFRQKIISISERHKLKTNIATSPKLYGLPKIHKVDFPLRPICSFINSPSYELCRYLTNILKRITEHSIYNVKDSVQFKEKLSNHCIQTNEKLISLDVVSLFPSVPVDLALEIIEEKWSIVEQYTKIDKGLFFRILKFCIEDNRYFCCNGKVYTQLKGLPMGSPASPIVADIVMERLLDTSIGKLNIKPKIMIKYVDDLFCIITEDGVNNLLDTFNEFNSNIKFTLEMESNSKLPFLDTLIIRNGNNLLIDWYQKPTASGRILNYYSGHSRRIIINTAKNLINRVLTISDKVYHRKNIIKIRNILRDNNFPNSLSYGLINQYKDRSNENDRIMRPTEPMIYKSLSYISNFSERIKESKIFNNDKYKITYKAYNTLNSLFSKTKDKTSKWDMSNIVYKIPCKGNDNERCNQVYIGTTKNKLKTRIAGHRSDQKYRDINSKKTALSHHCHQFNHYPNFEEASVLNTETNYKRRYILEMLQIINTPITQRINFKADTEHIANNYRNLVIKR